MIHTHRSRLRVGSASLALLVLAMVAMVQASVNAEASQLPMGPLIRGPEMSHIVPSPISVQSVPTQSTPRKTVSRAEYFPQPSWFGDRYPALHPVSIVQKTSLAPVSTTLQRTVERLTLGTPKEGQVLTFRSGKIVWADATTVHMSAPFGPYQSEPGSGRQPISPGGGGSTADRHLGGGGGGSSGSSGGSNGGSSGGSSGISESDADGRYVNVIGDTMVGGLRIEYNGLGLAVTGSISGAIIHAEQSLSSSGTLVWEGDASGSTLYVARSLNGAGLADCDNGTNSKLLWDSTTGRFSCGTDQSVGTGLDINSGDARYVKKQGDTMTGALTIDVRGGDANTIALKIINTLSGANIHAERSLTSSGTLVAEGLTNLNGNIVLGDATSDTVTFTARIASDILPTIDGSYNLGSPSLRFGSGYFASGVKVGNSIYILSDSIEGTHGINLVARDANNLTLTTNGVERARIDSAGRFGIGVTDASVALEVLGTASGTDLFATRSITGSHLYIASTVGGAGLASCSGSTNKLLYNATTKQFTCGTDLNTTAWSSTGSLQNAFDSRYVNTSGDTMTGNLLVKATLSGRTLIVSQNASISGALISAGNITTRATLSGARLYVANTASISGSLVIENSLTGASFYGFGLTDCSNSTTSKLIYNATTGKFSCATDQSGIASNWSSTGALQNAFDSRYVNTSGDTMTGNLLVKATLSGRTLIVSQNASVSGALVVAGNITTRATLSGARLYVANTASISGSLVIENSLTGANFYGFGLTDCSNSTTSKLIYNATTGKFSCAVDQNTTYTAGQGLTLNGSVFRLSDSFSGTTIKVLGSLSGAIIHAERTLTSSGTILADGSISTRATLSGKTLTVMNGNSFILGNTTIGSSAAADTKLEVIGTISGSNLFATNNITSSGTLLMEGQLFINNSTSNSAPGLAIAGDTNTGLGAFGDDNLMLIVGGVQLIRFTGGAGGSSQMRSQQGSATAPMYSFQIDSDTGLYSHAPNVLGVATNGAKIAIFTATGFVVQGSISGSRLIISNHATISGALVTVGNITTRGTLSGARLYVANTASISGSLVIENSLTGANFYGFGLTDCSNSTTSKLIYNATTGKFSCASDQNTGTTYTAGQGLTLNGSVFRLSDSFSGTTIKVLGSLSGAIIHAERTLTSSGTITAVGNITTRGTLSGTSIYDTSLANCNGVNTVKADAQGHLYCATDEGGAGASSKWTDAGSLTYLTSTSDDIAVGGSDTNAPFYFSVTSKRLEVANFSGTSLRAQNSLASSGVLVVAGNATIRGTLSGNILHAEKSLSSSGTILATGNITTRATLSGARLYVANTASISGSLVIENSLTGATFYGFGLTDCTSATSKLIYNATTGKFSCGTDLNTSWSSTGSLQNSFDTRYVNTSGDTMTGNLLVKATLSGRTLIVSQNASISGALITAGNITTRATLSGARLYVANTASISGSLVIENSLTGASFYGFGLTDCSNSTTSKLIYNATTGKFSCATDQSGIASNWSSTGALQNAFDSRYVNTSGDTMTGNLLVKATLSGRTLIVSQNASISGALVTAGNITTRATLSGARLYVANTASISGSLVIENSLTGATFYGFGLTDCSNSTTSKLIYNATTGKFSCGTDQGGSYTAGQGLTLTATSFRLSDTFSGTTVKVLGSLSGAIIHAEKSLSSSGILTVNGNTRIRGTLSGASIFAQKKITSSGSISISRPQLSVVATLSLTDVASLFTVGKYAYITEQGGGTFQVIDISSTTPVSVGSVSLGGGNGYDMHVAGRYAYVADGTSGVQIIDISKPSAPVTVSTLSTTSAQGVFVAGQYLYIADGSSGMRIVDISNPASPRIVGSSASAISAKDVWVSGRYAYLADYSSGLRIIDVSIPTAPFTVSTLSLGGNIVNQVQVVGRYAYASTFFGFYVVDVKNPASPVSVGNVAMSSNASSLDVQGHIAYVADNIYGTKVVDITSPTSPTIITTLASASSAYEVMAMGKYLYVGTDSGLKVVDIGTVDVPSASIGSLEVFGLNVLQSAKIDSNLTVSKAVNIDAGLYVYGPSAMRTYSGAALTLSTQDKNASPALVVQGAISGYKLIISGNGTFSGALIVKGNTTIRGTLSGNIIHAEKTLTSSGTMLATGNITTRATLSGARLYVANTATISGSLVIENSLTGASFFGFGLTDCNNSTTSKLIYNATTGKFSCATDQTGGGSNWSNTGSLQNSFDSRYVNTSGDTMTGALLVKANLSGSRLIISQNANISGALLVNGNVGIGTTNPGQKLTVVGNIDLNVNGSPTIGNNTFGGNFITFANTGIISISAPNAVTTIASTQSSGSSDQTSFSIDGTITKSGTTGYTGLRIAPTLTSLGSGLNYLFDAQGVGSSRTVITTAGDVGIGSTSPKAKLDVVGTISGKTLVISGNASVSGALVTLGNITTRGTLSGARLFVANTASISGSLVIENSLTGASFYGFGLTDCSNSTTSKIIYNASTGKFSCATDQNIGTIYTAGQGLTLTATSFRLSDTFSGTTVKVLGTLSGAHIHAEKLLTSSGTLVTESGAYIDGSTFVVQAGSNRIGIGTASPTAQLTISGSSPEMRMYANGSYGGLTRSSTNNELNLYNRVLMPSTPVIGVAFSGAGSQYTISSTDGTGVSAVTLSFWVKRSASASTTGIMQWANSLSSGAPFVYLRDASGTLTWYVNGGFNLAGGTLTDNAWTHIAVTWDGSVWRSYKNGSEVTNYSGGGNNIANASSLYFGNGYDGYWTGSMDEIRAYSDDLSAATILSHYNSGIGSYGSPSESSIMSGWHFDENTGVTAEDFTSANKDMTLTSGASWTTGLVGAGATSEISGLSIIDGVTAGEIGIVTLGDSLTRTILNGNILIFQSGDTEYMRLTNAGNLGIGTTSAKAKLDVVGAISGSRLIISGNASITGALVTRGNITTRGTLSGARLYVANTASISGSLVIENSLTGATFFGFGLTDCSNSTTSKLIYNASTGKFSCATDQTGGGSYTAGQGLTLTSSSFRLSDTFSGTTVKVYRLLSGASIHAEQSLTSSGVLKVVQSTVRDSGALVVDQRANGTGAYMISRATGAPLLVLETSGTTSRTAHIVFGYLGTLDTNLYRVSANTLRTDGSFQIVGTLSGAYIHAEKSLTSSGVLKVVQSTVRDSGALVVDQRANATGAYITSLASSSPLLVLNTSSNNPASTHILFGYQGTFDVSLARTASRTLTLSGHLLPGSTNTFDLGSNTQRWRDLYLSGGTLKIGGNGNEALLRYNTSASRFSVSTTSQTDAIVLLNSNGNVGIGTASPKAKLDVMGTISGKTLVISGNASISGALVVKNNITARGTLSGARLYVANTASISGSLVIENSLTGATFFGFGLTDCSNATTSKLIYNASTGKFSCATDQTGGVGVPEVGTASFSGAVLRLNDLRYLLKSGGTMTGTLTLQPTTVRQTALKLVGSGSYTIMGASGGSIIHTARGNLSYIGNYATAGQVAGVTVVGRYVYAVDLSGVFYVIDASNPSSPTLMSNLSLGGSAYNISVVGRYAYVTNATSGLRIIDVSNPRSPVLVGTQPLANAFGVFVAGHYAYVAGLDNGLQIVDISDPKLPALVGSYNTPGQAYGVSVAGRYAYVADYTSGLQIIDVSNPLIPQFIGTYASTKAWAVSVVGRYAYIADDSSGMRIVDVSNPASPSLVSTFASEQAIALTVAGRYAYVMNSGVNMKVVDVSNPASPKLSGIFNSTGTYQGIAVSGRIAYIPDSTIGGVALIDLNGIDTPTATIGALEAGSLNVLTESRFNANLIVDRALNVGDGLYVYGQTSMRAFSGSALTLSTQDKTGKPALIVSGTGTVAIGTGSSKNATLHVVGTISGRTLVISGQGSFSGALVVRQTLLRGSGAFVVDQRSTGTGVYIRGSYVSANGNRSPLLALDSGTASSLAPHILFGYKGSFDVSMFRSGSGALTIASSTGKTLTLDSGRTDATGNVFEIFSDYSTTNNKVFRVQANGTTYADGAYNATGADYAEWFFDSGYADQKLQPGELVCIDVLQNNAVRRCERSGDANLMGIVSTNPAFIGNTFTGADGVMPPGYVLVGLIGQVPAKVSLENGDIHAGDALTSAETPGVARKANAGESTVGVALEAYDGTQASDIINVLISRKNQSVTVELVEQHIAESIADMGIEDKIAQSLQDSLSALDLDDKVRSSLSAELSKFDLAGQVHAIINQHVASGSLASGSALASAESRISALTASSAVLSARIQGNTDALTGLRDNVQVLQSFFTDGVLSIDAVHTTTLTAQTITARSLTVSGATVLSGHTSIGSLDVDGSRITIGSLTSPGAFEVIGTVTIDGLARFLGDVRIEGQLVLSSKQAGFAIIPATGSRVTVHFDTPLIATGAIHATPQARVGAEWWVEYSTATGFTIAASSILDHDVRFAWTAIAVERPRTVMGTGSLHGSAGPIPFYVNLRGQPTSSDHVWNACIQGRQVILDGNVLSCSRYHSEYTWEHPDLLISFTYNPNHEPPILLIPDGYIITTIDDGSGDGSVTGAGGGSTAGDASGGSSGDASGDGSTSGGDASGAGDTSGGSGDSGDTSDGGTTDGSSGGDTSGGATDSGGSTGGSVDDSSGGDTSGGTTDSGGSTGGSVDDSSGGDTSGGTTDSGGSTGGSLDGSSGGDGAGGATDSGGSTDGGTADSSGGSSDAGSTDDGSGVVQ